jgi:hypothetical protein
MEKHKWHQLLQQAMLASAKYQRTVGFILCLKKYLMALIPSSIAFTTI